MFHKWKNIISNWINCYFNNTENEEVITIDTLLTVISHLHKNLDESISPISRNIDEFILEKYPEFKFENETVVPGTEEEIYMVASLLLFFVCMNSKDLDIKQAMCSKLSLEDQEIIMKYTKSLMECSSITYGDVQAAITEACGINEAAVAKAPACPVAETPPVLRSLHGEVRKLQAALDAERFDRNYLQEELSRTQLRMEKLQKDKEQYKLEIVNLKSKILLCCGEEAEARGSEAAIAHTEKLSKQLQDLEERLVVTQEKLDDVLFERDTFKSKIEELKQERDKWLTIGQEESIRACQLSDQLDDERRRVQTLQEVVAELRQHQQKNCLDASQLECDDPDASIHSLHNASVCSEACSNVIEVQLGEERAKIVVLKQQIQYFQDQLAELTQKAETEKLALKNIITERDNELFNLKHRINEEIEDKNSMKVHYTEEISKLNIVINELDQKLKESSENLRCTTEQKLREIQTLQEEKLSLLHSLSDEITKLHNVIKDLKTDIDTEKNLKVKMKEEYENQLMALNEKVGNRNNELVELQNKVFENGELIEQLNRELKQEKELNHELSNKFNDEILKLNNEKETLENVSFQKTEEAKELQKRLLQNVAIFEELNRENDDLKAINQDLLQHRDTLLAEIQQRDSDVRKEIENITNIFSDEKNKFMRNLEEKIATISALQVRLRDEIQYKIGLEKELQHLHQAKSQLNEDILKLNKDLTSCKADLAEKVRMIFALELYLKEEGHINKSLKAHNEKFNAQISAKNNEMASMKEKHADELARFEKELSMKNEEIESLNNELLSEKEEKEIIQIKLMSITEEKEIINNDLIERCSELEKLQEDYERICSASEQNVKVIESLEERINTETKKYLQLEIDFDTQISNLMAKIHELEKSQKESNSKSRLMLEDKERQIQMLTMEVNNLSETLETEREALEVVKREKEALNSTLQQEVLFRNSIEKEYQYQCAMLDNITCQLNGEIALKSNEISSLKHELVDMMCKANEKSEELRVMESKLIQENEASKELAYLKNQEIKVLKNKIDELRLLNDEYEQELKKEVASKTQAISALQAENEQLHFTIEEDNSNHEIIVKEKDVLIENLEEHVKALTISLESIRKDYEDSTFTWESTKVEMQDNLTAKDNEIIKLKEFKISCVQDMEKMKEELYCKDKIIKENVNNEIKLQTQIKELETKLKTLERDIANKVHESQNQIAAIELLNKDKDNLLKQNSDLIKDLQQEQSALKAVQAKETALEEEKSSLIQQLSEGNKLRADLEQEKQYLLESIRNLEDQISKKLAAENQLLKEKEYQANENTSLSHQIEALEVDRQSLFVEKQMLEAVKEHLMLENKNRSQQLETLEQVNKTLLVNLKELEQKLVSLESKEITLWKEREHLILEKENLAHQLEHTQKDKENVIKEMQRLEQLLIVKEESTIKLLAEKEHLIVEKESLSLNLESGDQVTQTLLTEKQVLEDKLIAKESLLKSLAEENEQLLVEKSDLLEQLETAHQQRQILIAEKTTVDQHLEERDLSCKMLLQEKEQLDAEKGSILGKLEKVMEEMQIVKQQLFEEIAEKNVILEESQELSQELLKERLNKEKEDLEKQVLLADIQTLDNKLLEKEAFVKDILEKLDRMSQQIKDETLIKTQLEEERHYLLHEKNEITEKRNQDINKLNELNHLIMAKDEEISRLNKVLIEETSLKVVCSKEKQSLLSENSCLKHNMIDLHAVQEILIYDKEQLIDEKETLAKSLNEEKASHDELESEKNAVSVTLQQLNEKYTSDIKEKQDQISTINTELKQVKMDLKKHEDINVHLASLVDNALDKLLQNIKTENIDNSILQKLSSEKKEYVSLYDKCSILINVAESLSTELIAKNALEIALEKESSAVKELRQIIQDKEMQVLNLRAEVQRLEKALTDSNTELKRQLDAYNITLDSKIQDIKNLQNENKSLNNELNDVKVQLDVKVHSLKEKLTDNENLTDKLKQTYETQIENLNVMITKVTGYLKEKSSELDVVRKEKENLKQVIDEKDKAIKSFEEQAKSLKANNEKLLSDFEAERQVYKNMVTVTESVMEDQKVSMYKIIEDNEKTIESYQNEKKIMQEMIENLQKQAEEIAQEKQNAFDAAFKELTEVRKEKDDIVKAFELDKSKLNQEISTLREEKSNLSSKLRLVEVRLEVLEKEKEQLKSEMGLDKERSQQKINELINEIKEKVDLTESLQTCNKELTGSINKLQNDLLCLREKDTELKIKKDSEESELLNRITQVINMLSEGSFKNDQYKTYLKAKLESETNTQEKFKVLTDEVITLVKEKDKYVSDLDEVKAEAKANQMKANKEIQDLRTEGERLTRVIEENKAVIANLEKLVKRELDQTMQLRKDSAAERLTFENRCSLLQEYQAKAEKQLEMRDKEIASLNERIKTEQILEQTIEDLKEEICKKDAMITKIAEVKDEVINTLSNELKNEKLAKEKYQKELELKATTLYELRQKLEEAKSEATALETMRKENDELIKAVGQHAVTSQTSGNKDLERDFRGRHQVSTPTSDLTHSSMDSFKTITDLEKIIDNKNRTITTQQSDIAYLQSLMAESENKLLDVRKELEMSKENCEQLSIQLKKLVHQKNEEIAELKKQLSKMSVTENRATQIIKVSAKYQAIILKRIAEIKSNTILKELTNFGNTANCDSDLKRNLNSGSITLEDLESFLETTDRHLKKCSEKQLALQKERDRLTEINRINESEIINLKKFLTELSVSFKTFNSIKDLYTQKLSRVVSMQRTVRRELLNLDGHVTDSTMCKLERGYAAVMQDLCECSMNLERWVERSIARTISAEKIKQAFTSDVDRASLASNTFQNASIEVQLEELENSFQKLLEEVVRAQKGEGAKDAQVATVMEVRAEYEDKLNRMKTKMKQLYQEQIQVFKTKQKEEIAHLEHELQKTKEKLAESSRAYEEHIKALTTELWNVGEKFLMKKDEAEWLRRKKSTSLISLQHLRSTGLTRNQEEHDKTDNFDAESLRSLPVRGGTRVKREGRGLQMSDEEGEVFDNRCLKELLTPRRESNAGQRLSELRWRNSLCPPHLKSSYPAETQFANTLDEEEIKCVGAASLGGRAQRKEVGITAYKKPGPPTPSKQAGRLSATDCELRESLRPEPEAAPSRKTSTPSRILGLFRSGRQEDLPDSKMSKCHSGKPKSDSETLESDTAIPKGDIGKVECDNEKIISDTKTMKCDTEKSKCGSENIKCDTEIVKCETEILKCKTEIVKCDTEIVKCDTEIVKCDTENLKCDTENLKCDTENLKCEIEKPKYGTENPTTDKTDWFKLTLRQRAARWEPLAKD